MLLAASEHDDGELAPGFTEKVRRRRQAISDGGEVVPSEALRSGKS